MGTLKKIYSPFHRSTIGGKESLGAVGQKTKKQKAWDTMTRDQKDLVFEYAGFTKSKNKTYPEGAKTIDEKRKEKKSIINKIKKIAEKFPTIGMAAKIAAKKGEAEGGLIKGYNKGGHITTKGWGKARKT